MPDPAMPVVILKLGGSLIENQLLEPWLHAVGELARSSSVLIVTGGGSLADAVRRQQQKLRFDDRTAHRMAILAMEQNAWLVWSLLAARHSGQMRPTAVVQSREECLEASRHTGIAVWRPDLMTAAAADIEASWQMTSDALAAWLAGTLQASALVLAKMTSPADGRAVTGGAITDYQALSRAGLVDPLFPRYAAIYAGPWTVLSDPAQLQAAIAAPHRTR